MKEEELLNKKKDLLESQLVHVLIELSPYGQYLSHQITVNYFCTGEQL